MSQYIPQITKNAGYLGATSIIFAHWLLLPHLYIVGFIGLLIQTIYAKSWNLVAVQVNGLLAWFVHYITSL